MKVRLALLALLLGLVIVAGRALRADDEPPIEKPAVAKPAAKVAAKLATVDEGKLYSVTGLSLDAPQQRTRPGVATVKATVDAKATSKVVIVWDVEASFEDEDVEFSWEARPDNRSVQVVIPDSSGIIRVAALAIVDGEPTSTRLAKTVVEVRYTPRVRTKPLPPVVPPLPAPVPTPKPPAKEEGHAKAPRPAVAVSDAYFVLGGATDPNLDALVKGVSLKNALRRAGVTRHVVAVGSPEQTSLGLDRYVRDAGGAPCLVLVTEARKVRRTVKLTPTATQESILAEIGR